MFGFDQLLKCQAAIHRHLQAPFPNERLRYLQYLHAQGAARPTLIGRSWLLLAIVRGVRPKPPQFVTQAQIKAAARRWIHRRHGHQPRLTNGKAGQRIYVSLARQWFGFLGWLATKPAERPYAKELDAYVHYMRTERNFSPATIRTCHDAAVDFLRWIHSRHIELAHITAVTVDRQLACKARHGVGRVGIQSYGSHLRSFLRFAEQCHWSPQGVAAGIELGRIYKTESLPIGPPWEAVVRMLEQKRGTRASQIRDRAILLLFALYGLRSSEVRRLRIEDIDWEHALIHVHRSKQSLRIQTYPLAGVVRDALTDYLQHVRPKTDHSEVFLQLRMPYRPLRSSAFWQVVSKRLRPMQLRLKRHGPHALRHACATYLLSRGFSMKVIGDFLGHRYLGSTSTYAKVDIAGLRRVADFDLEGVLCSSNMP